MLCTCFLRWNRYRARVQNFDDIRPFNDEEVPGVVASLVNNPELRDGIALFLFPRLYRVSKPLSRQVTGLLLKWRARELKTVQDVQVLMRRYIDHMVRDSVVSLSTSGMDALPTDEPCLFVSNHRDIVLDTVFLNRVLYAAGRKTCRMAVGDNLLSTNYAADIMRLNKSFVVERSAVGTKAIFNAMKRTSAFIRQSLDQGEPVWIAQRSGRAKDGFDRTEPALLKMLALAYRDETKELSGWLERVNLVPVAISYELDPCDLAKAEELQATEAQGEYTKSSTADLDAIITSVTNKKGRVHVAFGEPVAAPVESAEELARKLDQSIVSGLKVYPTHLHAFQLAQQASTSELDAATTLTEPEEADTLGLFKQRLESCEPALRPHLLMQYTNLVQNRININSLP